MASLLCSLPSLRIVCVQTSAFRIVVYTYVQLKKRKNYFKLMPIYQQLAAAADLFAAAHINRCVCKNACLLHRTLLHFYLLFSNIERVVKVVVVGFLRERIGF